MQSHLISHICSVIKTFHILESRLHFLALPVPFCIAHLTLALEEFLVWLTIGTAKAVPQRGKLAIVIIEVEMVHRVAGSAVDDGRFRNVFTVVYKEKIQLRGV